MRYAHWSIEAAINCYNSVFQNILAIRISKLKKTPVYFWAQGWAHGRHKLKDVYFKAEIQELLWIFGYNQDLCLSYNRCQTIIKPLERVETLDINIRS